MNIEDTLIHIKNDALTLTLEAKSVGELEQIKLQFLGRSGKLTLAIKGIAKLAEEKRPEVGRLANEIKETVEETIKQQEEKLKAKEWRRKREEIDVTAPGIPPRVGHLHPLTQVLSDCIDIFGRLGFQVAEGPEIETDYYNFEVLNIPKDHPSRDTQMTLYLDTRGSNTTPGEIILRTQTSNMQGRIMEKAKPPLRVIIPGKVFRYESVDASHGFEFWQLEGFMVDKTVTLTELFGTLEYFYKQFFGKETKVRFVCHNFPFVEPGAEVYITCSVCKAKGCSFCKQSGSVEIAGAGMIHPNVFKAVDIDSRKWQGFAFGMGLSRMVTLRYHMDDLRLLTNPDLRILEQF